MTRRLLRAAFAASFLFTLLPVTVALADADLESAMPGPGDQITDVPDELVATFTEALEPDRSSIEVRLGDDVVARGGNVESEPTIMRAALPELEPGEYTVRWTTYSTDDNHLFRGTYTFEVLPPPTPTPTPIPTPSQATATPVATPTRLPEPTSEPSPSAAPEPPNEGVSIGLADLLIPIVVLVIVLGAITNWIRRQRR